MPLTSNAGKGDQEFTVHNRDSRWLDDVLHNGLCHICQRVYCYRVKQLIIDNQRPQFLPTREATASVTMPVIPIA